MGRRIQSTAADMEPAEGVPVVVVDGVPVDSLPYRTLSDVDEKLVSDVRTLYNAFFAQLETGHAGDIIEGATHEPYNSAGYWGREIEIPGRQHLQMRFSPPSILQKPLAEGCVATFSVRITPQVGGPWTATALVWPLPTGWQSAVEKMDVMGSERFIRQHGPVGLHLLSIGLWERAH